jgi:peptidoglycan/xylan/chitin deacetylase (PgdA/CDA1 family)
MDETIPNPFNFLFITVSQFAERMQVLNRSGYTVLPLSDAITKAQIGTMPADAVAITIDDGWYGTWKHMLPTLNELRLPATLYLTTEAAESQRPVLGVALTYLLASATMESFDTSMLAPGSGKIVQIASESDRDAALDHLITIASSQRYKDDPWSFLEHLADLLEVPLEPLIQSRQFCIMSMSEAQDARLKGLDLQLHTHNHRSRDANGICLESEIAANRDRLVQLGAVNPTHFCYPSGDWSNDMHEALRRAGVVSATTTEIGMYSALTDVLAIPRILDGARIDLLEFEAELAGVFEIKRAVAKRIRSIFQRAST